MASKGNAFLHQAMANAEAARLLLDKEQTQLGDFGTFLDQENGADDLAVAFGDPAAFAFGVEILDEFGGNASHQGLEGLVPAIFLSIKQRLSVDDPAHVAGAMRP